MSSTVIRQFRQSGLEVRQEGSVVQSVQIPVSYKTHLTELTLEDSWGHKLGGDLKDTLDDQQMEVLVPQNTKYININAWAPGWHIFPIIRNCYL